MDQNIAELLNSINSSIDDIKAHPTKSPETSMIEIAVRGLTSSSAIDLLFSPKLDDICNKLLNDIESGNFEKVLANYDGAEKLVNSMFGNGSFQGPVSRQIINSVSNSVNSYKYQTMKTRVSKIATMLRKKRLVLKNLKKDEKVFKGDPETLKKYRDAVYAIKQVLKIIEKIYQNRKIVNKKLFDGVNAIIHESEKNNQE